MKIALCQINPVVGDLRGNADTIVNAARQAHRRGADLAVFPEMSVTGYPPLDLLDNPCFLDSVDRAVTSIAAAMPSQLGVIIGGPIRNADRIGKRLFNAALLLEGGKIVDQINKSLLPTYDVYDEFRYFEPANRRRCMEWRGTRLGVHICEDMWNSDDTEKFRMYHVDPLGDLARDGADLFINLSATPFAPGKHARRTALIESICNQFKRPFILVNQVGANTELIFDGDSRVHLSNGRLALCAPSFEESVLIWDTERNAGLRDSAGETIGTHSTGGTHRTARATASTVGTRATAETDAFDGVDATDGAGANRVPGATETAPRDDTADVYRALILGIQDYMRKSRVFTKVVIGVSGGIDSAVTCALAVDALGPENVIGVTMPSQFTAPSSLEDARRLARNLDIELREFPIGPALHTLNEMLADAFAGTRQGVAEENVQARVRGVILMAMANKFNYLLLSTSNKSEAAVGYTTLYGDMTGGVGVLSDVFKTQVYELARYINSRGGNQVIPHRVLEKPPSAELRPGQVDQDSLPPYEELDAMLKLYVEEKLDVDAIVERTGFDRGLVHDILRRVDAAEFKRRQAPPGLRVSDKSFGLGRRMPLAMNWDRTFNT